MGATVAARNKKVRQEALRDQLQAKGLHTQVLVIAEKLNDQHLDLEQSAISALKASADIKMKLVNKYMPDLKAVEHSNDPDNPIGESTDAEVMARIKILMAKHDGE
jgi:hypothetical protein